MRAAIVLLVLLAPACTGPAAAHAGIHTDEGDLEGLVDLPLRSSDDAGAALALAAEVGLWGGMELAAAGFSGAFVSGELHPNGSLRSVRLAGDAWLDALVLNVSSPEVHVEGPVLVVRNETAGLTLHDNPRGWLSVRGVTSPVVLTLAGAGDVRQVGPDRYALSSLAGQGRLVVGSAVKVITTPGEVRMVPLSAEGVWFTLAQEPGPLASPLEPSLWVAGAFAEGAFLGDTLRFAGAPHRLDHAAPGRLAVELVGLIGADRQDTLAWFELAGILDPEDLSTLAVTLSGEGLDPVSARAIEDPRPGRPGYHVEVEDDVVRLQVRARAGNAGLLVISADDTTPNLQRLATVNLTDAWRPDEAPPGLIVEADEPVTVSLALTHEGRTALQQRATTLAAVHRFSASGLSPGRTYEATVTLVDASGNEASFTGEVVTPLPPGPLEVELRSPSDGATYGEGPIPVRASLEVGGVRTGWPGYRVLLDGRDVTTQAKVVRGTLGLDLEGLAAGEHTVVVQAGPDADLPGEARATFLVARPPFDVPGLDFGPLLLALVLVALAVRRIK